MTEDKLRAAAKRKTNILEAAKAWASQSYRVAPIHSDKKPASFTRTYASTIRDVEELFERGCNYGYEGFIMCTDDNLLVLDLDRHGAEDGVAVFEAYCQEQGYSPNTYTEATPRDGRHLFFRRPEDCHLLAPNNGEDRVLPSVDTMTGPTGRLIMAPSFREDGEYTIVNNVPMEIAPPCIVRLFKERVDLTPNKVELGEPNPNNPYVRGALAKTVERIKRLPEGSRNTGFFSSAASIYRYVAGGELSDEEVTETLTNVALSIGLEEKEIAATLSSARKRGRADPRQAPKPSSEDFLRAADYLFSVSDDERSVPDDEVISQDRIPLDVFPPKVARFIEEVARSTGGDPNIVGSCVLSEADIQIGRAHVVEVKRGWQEGANLYIAIIAKSGEGKTPIEKLVSAPRVDLEAALREDYEREVEAYKKAMAVYAKELKRQGSEYEGKEPEKPRLIRYTMDDFTMETLPRNLKDNPKGIGIVKDELKSLFIQSKKYSVTGDNGLIQILISAYNYVSITVDRMDEEKNVYVPRSCLSIRGMIQPGVLYSTLSKDDIDSGFVPRFSFIYGDRQRIVSLYDEGITSESEQDWKDTIIKLATIDLTPDRDEEPKVIHLTEEAKKVLNYAIMAIGLQKEREPDDLLRSFYSKLPEKIIRFTNILHHLYLAENSPYPDWLTDVPVEVVEKAINLGTWVEHHFRRFVNEFVKARIRPRKTLLQQSIDEVLAEIGGDVKEDGKSVPYEIISQKLSERLGRPVKPQEYNEYLAALGCVSVQNLHIPGSKKRGRGAKIPQKVFERVSSVSNVSSYQNAVLPSASGSGNRNDIETIKTIVSNVSMPTEYLI